MRLLQFFVAYLAQGAILAYANEDRARTTTAAKGSQCSPKRSGNPTTSHTLPTNNPAFCSDVEQVISAFGVSTQAAKYCTAYLKYHSVSTTAVTTTQTITPTSTVTATVTSTDFLPTTDVTSTIMSVTTDSYTTTVVTSTYTSTVFTTTQAIFTITSTTDIGCTETNPAKRSLQTVFPDCLGHKWPVGPTVISSACSCIVTPSTTTTTSTVTVTASPSIVTETDTATTLQSTTIVSVATSVTTIVTTVVVTSTSMPTTVTTATATSYTATTHTTVAPPYCTENNEDTLVCTQPLTPDFNGYCEDDGQLAFGGGSNYFLANGQLYGSYGVNTVLYTVDPVNGGLLLQENIGGTSGRPVQCATSAGQILTCYNSNGTPFLWYTSNSNGAMYFGLGLTIPAGAAPAQGYYLS